MGKKNIELPRQIAQLIRNVRLLFICVRNLSPCINLFLSYAGNTQMHTHAPTVKNIFSRFSKP